MLGLAVRFELGRYHATPWGAHVNEGRVEWPPSPWRILRALVAASRTDVRLHSRRADVERGLERLIAAPPPAYELPAMALAHTRHFVPRPDKRETARILDGFAALDRTAELRVWWDASPSDEEREALGEAAAAVGHLGRSESVCSVRLVDPARSSGSLVVAVGDIDAIPEATEVVELLCPTAEGGVAGLAMSVTELRRRGLLMPPGAGFVRYAIPRPDAARSPAHLHSGSPTLARFRVVGGSRPSLREAVAIGNGVRAALQSQYGQHARGASSPVFSGRAGDERRLDQHRHAHYLVTPGRDGRRVDHVTVWAPEGFGPLEMESLVGLRCVRRHDEEPLRVVLTALGDVESVRLSDLLGPARRWRSLTPFGLVRHPKRRAGRAVDTPEDQIARELEVRGLPTPKEVQLEKGPWLDFRRARPAVSRLQAARVVGARVRFAEPVRGPIAIGALSHFGLGVFVPERG